MRRWFVCQKYIPERLSLQRIQHILLFTGASRTNKSLSCTRDSEKASRSVTGETPQFYLPEADSKRKEESRGRRRGVLWFPG